VEEMSGKVGELEAAKRSHLDELEELRKAKDAEIAALRAKLT
jgi:hypothetical protein